LVVVESVEKLQVVEEKDKQQEQVISAVQN
jgi:hypothetical protein